MVNAAGVWSPDVAASLGHTVPLTLLVQQAMITAKAQQSLQRVIVHAGGRLSLKQMQDGNILIGGLARHHRRDQVLKRIDLPRVW